MTIAVGFKCSDGILLASDTMYSGVVQNTFGPKFWVVRKRDPAVVFGGAGTVGPLTRARREIKRVLKTGMTVNDALDAIDDVLRRIDEKFPSKTELKHVQALVSIRTDIENALFQNIYGEVALSPVDAPAVCLGVDTLGNYFTGLLYQNQMPIKWAKAVAAHLIKNCKLYASGYCGGETHLFEVPDKGDPVFTDDQAEMKKLEAHLADFDDAMRALLPGNDPNATDLSISHRLTELQAAIHRIRGLAVASLSGVQAKGATGSVAVAPSDKQEDDEDRRR
jgi:hypothetical protein